jgi:hypothetical protein
MKTFDYLRHGKKDGGNISAEGLAEAVAAGLECPVKYHYAVGGNESRTWQTLCAFIVGALQSMRLLTPIAKFGDSTLFNSWLARGLAFAAQNLGSFIKGLHSILPEPEFQAASADALAGVLDVFQQMEDNTTCIGFGHSPIIELAAIGSGMKLEDVPALKELEGLRFIQHDDGTITVASLQ